MGLYFRIPSFRIFSITAKASLFAALLCAPALALEPHEILVVANRNATGSEEIARYYMEERGIPAEQLLSLEAPDRETCSRDEYEIKVVRPLRDFIEKKDLKKQIRCLLTIYGLPLRVAAAPPDPATRARNTLLSKRKSDLSEQLQAAKERKDENLAELDREMAGVEKELTTLKTSTQGAALDSEIALALWDDYPLARWIPNPFFLGHQGRWVEGMPEKGAVLMVSRLDGPDVETVRRIVDDSIRVEKEGLKGVAYFDARWPKPSAEKRKQHTDMGYEFYDGSIHAAAEVVQKSGRMPVVIDDKQGLFQPGECPDAAIYCGWYSLAKYVDAFKWRPGAVGYHIASSECRTLKQKGSQVWCKRMLEEGVAATVGPVNEPYVQAFPIPELFFKLLLDGYWTLAESYALSQPFWSWQMVLIGDPLYRPFKNSPGKK
jgi:uncharacterized protein (TIGR03790 family)